MAARWRKRIATTVAAVAAIAVLSGFALRLPETNFSQFRGFEAMLKDRPLSGRLPDAEHKALLERFRPRLFAPAGHEGPIDFYRDYVAQGFLARTDGQRIAEAVTPELLNAHKDDPRIVFTHVRDAGKRSEPVVFARADEILHQIGTRLRKLTLLTYHVVFRHSGLPARLPVWLAAPVSLLDAGDDWHQLDHYTAATVVLGEDMKPAALMLQQHNYHRTYLFGETVKLPDDGRVALDIAVRSNELYPHAPGRRVHKAVRFMTPHAFRYMLGAGRRPPVAGEDVTAPAREVDYRLDYLAADDAFYSFKGFLGARRRLPGRSGPPGAFYNTLPALKRLSIQMLSGYWRPGNKGDMRRLEHAITTSSDPAAFARGQTTVFSANFLCARRWGPDCAFE